MFRPSLKPFIYIQTVFYSEPITFLESILESKFLFLIKRMNFSNSNTKLLKTFGLIRGFVKHQRLENSLSTTRNSLAKFR